MKKEIAMLAHPRRTKLVFSLLVAGILAAVPGSVWAGQYLDLGRPVIGGWIRGGWVVWDPVLKRDVLWAQECSQDGAVLFALDLDSGKVIEEHDVPARELGGLLQAADGVLYLYTYSGLNHPGNELLRFDPRKRKIERLGLADVPHNRCVSGAIGPDGNVYIGTHQQGRLFKLDTKTETWSDLGQMVPEPIRPNQNIWLRNLEPLADGKILATVVRTPPAEVVLIDPKTGTFEKVEALGSRRYVAYGDKVLEPTREGIRVHNASLTDSTDLTLADFEGRDGFDAGERLRMVRVHPKLGLLGRVSDELVQVDLDHKRLARLGSLPRGFGRSFQLTSDGRAVDFDARRGRLRVLELKSGEIADHDVGYQGKRGTQICGLNIASDGSIYGTTIISMHLFRYDPESGVTRDLGHVGWGGSEAYNTIDYKGKIYFGTYGGAYWGVYDPSRPWNPDFAGGGTAEDANPRNLGHLGEEDSNDANRPFEYVLGPDENLYIACRANYGYPGGALVRFNPRTGEKTLYRDLLRSVQSVTANNRYLFGGTSIHGGRGSGDRADVATFFVHDPQSGKRVFEEALVPGTKAYVSVRFNPADGLVYATTDGQLLVAFDPDKFEVTGTWPIRSPGTPLAGVPEDVGMIHLTAASDGNVYGVTSRDLFRFNTQRRKIEYLDPPPIPGLYQIVEGEPGVFYLGARTHLLRYLVETPTFYR